MRVIAGAAKGMTLKSPRGREIRPTADRVKEALFSILGNRVNGATVLDLFAGSGALGIEALSRGAIHCTFVEINKPNLRIIRENLNRAGFAERSSLIGLDVIVALRRPARMRLPADLVFMDPPYRLPIILPVLHAIGQAGILHVKGLVVIEHPAKNQSWSEPFSPIRQEKYGNTMITFIDRSGLAAAAAVKEGPPDDAEKVEHRRRGGQDRAED